MRFEALTYYQNKLETFSDKELRLFKRVIPRDINKIKHIHITGICGKATASLAMLLVQAGFKVSGSDTECYPPMDQVIKDLGIIFYEGYSSSNLQGADVIVIGNVCGPTHIEAIFAREYNIPTLSLSEAVGLFFIKGKESLVVAGTHGKTTTTGLLAHIFMDAKLDPSYLIGGVSIGGVETAHVGSGSHFIIEGDEYDTAYFDKAPKFLHYAPTMAIITSLEFDHVDIYKDIESYTDAFKFLVQEIKETGALVLCGDIQAVKDLSTYAACDIDLYGLEEGNDITAKNILPGVNGQEFDLWIKNKNMGRMTLSLYGKHNLSNALACIAVSIRSGIKLEDISKALSNFKGMKKRQEVIYDKEITILDDFAHHPTAVRETLLAIRTKYPKRRLVAFFEPRSNTSRRKIFEEEYSKAFDEADLIFISTPPLKENDRKEDFINPEHTVEEINKRKSGENVSAFAYSNANDLLIGYKKYMKEGDVVLIMSNGSFDGVHQKLVKSLG